MDKHIAISTETGLGPGEDLHNTSPLDIERRGEMDYTRHFEQVRKIDSKYWLPHELVTRTVGSTDEDD